MIQKKTIMINGIEHDYVYSDLSVCLSTDNGQVYDVITLPTGQADLLNYSETDIIAEY